MYRPTPAEVKRANRLAKDLTPGRKVHDKYVEAARLFLGVADLLPFADYQGQRLRLESIRWHKSLLFEREYLIAHVDDGVLVELAPECDAIATVTSTIPLVLAPLRRRRSRSEAFLSILEHEFVHVNQALLGLAPAKACASTVGGAIAEFFDVVRVEYQANLLQLTKWPRLLPKGLEISLQQWCVLRGWVSALETAVCGVFCPAALMEEFLSRLPLAIRVHSAKFGVNSRIASWLCDSHPSFVRTALGLLKTRQPALLKDDAFLSAGRWLMQHEQRAQD